MPEDRVGEIWVRGGSVAAGYWGNEELTREVFGAECGTARPGCDDGRTQPGRAVSHSRWLRTGDLGFLHRGERYPAGRLKDMIKVRGRNLYPQDIEAAIAAALPWLALNGCAAFAVEKDGVESIGILIEADRAFARVLGRAGFQPAVPGILPGGSGVEKPPQCDTPPANERTTTSDAPGRIPGTAGKIPALPVEETLALIRQAVTEETEAAPALIAFTGPADFPRTTSGKVQRSAAQLIAITAGDERVLLAVGAAVPKVLECAGPPALWQERSDAVGTTPSDATVNPPHLRLPPQSARALA